MTLTNAVEPGVACPGILLSGHVRQIVIDAIVDIAAVRSVLPPHVADQLGLHVIGRQVA